MRVSTWIITLCLGLLVYGFGCSLLGGGEGTRLDQDAGPIDARIGPESSREEELDLDDVPENVRAAAIAAVPGLVLEEAEKETESGVVVYVLEGSAGGKEWEVEVSSTGRVLEKEEEDEDDDDDDDD